VYIVDAGSMIVDNPNRYYNISVCVCTVYYYICFDTDPHDRNDETGLFVPITVRVTREKNVCLCVCIYAY